MDRNIIAGSTKRATQSVRPAQPKNSLDHRQNLALTEWRRLSVNGGPPRRASFRPERIRSALPVSTLLGVERDGESISFRHRIEGKMVHIAFGENRGESFDEFFAPEHLAQSLPEFNDAVLDGRVTLTSVSAHTAGGAPFNFTRLLLPFRGQHNHVTRVLAVYGFDTDRLINLRAPLRMAHFAAATGMKRAERAYLRLKTA